MFQIGVEETAMPSPAGAWLGVGYNCSLLCGGRGCSSGQVDPNTYGQCPYFAFGGEGMSYRHVGGVCSVQETIIQGRGATPHPIHIHVNHFQVLCQLFGDISVLIDISISGD